METVEMIEKKDRRATLKIDPELHRLVKIACAQSGEKMELFVDRALRSALANAEISNGRPASEIALKGHRKIVRNG